MAGQTHAERLAKHRKYYPKMEDSDIKVGDRVRAETERRNYIVEDVITDGDGLVKEVHMTHVTGANMYNHNEYMKRRWKQRMTRTSWNGLSTFYVKCTEYPRRWGKVLSSD